MQAPLPRKLAALIPLALVTCGLGACQEGQALTDSVPSSAQGVEVSEAQAARIVELIEAAYEAGPAVGLSLAVVVDGTLAGEWHHGYEDLAAKVAVGPETRYRWASISKPLTAVAALQLAERDKLDLDADIRSVLPEFPEKKWPVTARQLLCHQGGIVHYSNGQVIVTQAEYDVEHPFADPVLALDRFKESPLIAEPGTRYAYTTHGYVLLSAVVQQAGDAPFADQVAARVLQPLGMTTTLPDQPWVEIPHRTKGYRKARLSGFRPDMYEDVHWKLGGGGYLSTISDLARFGQGMVLGKLLKPETQAAMMTSQVPADGKDPNYGLGCGVTEIEGVPVWQHSGSQSQTATFLWMAPDQDLAVAVMCNTRGFAPSRLGNRVGRYLLSEASDK